MYKPIRLADVPRRRCGGALNRIRDIERFIASGDDACEIILEAGEKPASVSGSIREAIKRRQYYSDLVEAFMRDGRVFIVRKKRATEQTEGGKK